MANLSEMFFKIEIDLILEFYLFQRKITFLSKIDLFS
jgi:hypothetical protein